LIGIVFIDLSLLIVFEQLAINSINNRLKVMYFIIIFQIYNIAHNISSIAEPAKRVAEAPRQQGALELHQNRAAAGGISVRPSTAGGLSPPRSGAVMLC